MQSFLAFIMSFFAILASLFNLNFNFNPTPQPDTPTEVVLPAVEANADNEYFDITYGTSSERQKLDLYLPKTGETSMPVVVFLHAGGWTMGDKNMVQSEGRKWAEKGIAAIVMNYHYIDINTTCDVLMNDITLAMQRAISVAGNWGVSFTGAIMGGGSAGGHLALLYSTKYVDQSPIKIKLCYSMAGPCDLTDKAFVTGNYLGDSEVCKLLTYLTGSLVTRLNYETPAVQTALALYSPITYINANTVPILQMHGVLDSVVPYVTAVKCEAVLAQNNVPHELVTLPNSNHDQAGDPELSTHFFTLLDEYIAQYAY